MKLKIMLLLAVAILTGLQAEENGTTRAVYPRLVLQQGWNAFSPMTVVTVANYKEVGLGEVLGYDEASKTYVQVAKCLPGKAYWTYCKADKLTVTLLEAPEKGVATTASGWNFVGYQSALPDWATEAESIWVWRNGRFELVEDAKQELQPGVGYWVYKD